MDIKTAKEIIITLAKGINPVTGEVFPDNSPYNHPKIIRALFVAAEQIHIQRPAGKKSTEEKQQENIRKGRPRNAGLPWTEDLRKQVAEMFRSGKSIKELANYFERTEGAIVSELVRQDLIKPEMNTYR
ncbi:MAG: hypothetical protein JRJ29_02470 [Deltaproteobacteria bacterium]|nr:hypothetical protein [Deltaproteobacteria bacterium]